MFVPDHPEKYGATRTGRVFIYPICLECKATPELVEATLEAQFCVVH